MVTGYFITVLNSAFRCIIRLPNLFSVATPQDKIIESQEAEILRLKAELSETEEKYQKVKVELDKMTKKWGFII